jgi:HEAT repeat protein/beta-lactamase regulating signal transducer with metallopeptidase domain
MTMLDLLLLVGGSLAKGALILLLAEAGTRLLRRHSASSRYAVWVVAFAGLCAIPVLTVVLPAWESPATVHRAAPPVTTDMGPPAMDHHMDHDMRLDPMFEPAVAPMAGSTLGGEKPWRAAARAGAPWLLAGWLAGVSFLLGLLVRDLRRVSRITARATVVRRGPLSELGHRVAAELGVRRSVMVALSRDLTMPISWGFRRPVVLLPVEARRWHRDRQLVVLRHELAHIRRRDYASHLLIELSCALHWLNPLVWRAARRARLEQERACDDRVLTLGTTSVDYAQELLDLVRSYAGAAVPARGALAMAAAATLPQRMRAILDAGIERTPVGRRTITAVTATGLLVGVPTAALHPWTDTRHRAELVAMTQSGAPAQRREAIWALGRDPSSPSRAAVLARLHDADPSTRGVAAWALGQQGDRDAVEPLVALLQDHDAHVREMAVLALGRLGDERAVEGLERLTDDPEPGVRSVMTDALQRIGGERSADALARIVRTDPDVHTRIMAANALSNVEGRSRIPTLEAALADPDPAVRSKAALSLASAESVPALLRALSRESDPDVRTALVTALGTSGDHRATPALVRVLAEDDSSLRETAALMLGRLHDETAVEPLLAATRDPSHRVRLTAVRALDSLRIER